MTNYDKKEEKVVEDAVKVLSELDINLGKLDQIESDEKELEKYVL